MAVRAGQREFLDGIEKNLEELRRKFELYFQGSKEQRLPPTPAQAQLGGELRRIREQDVRTWNTQDKFRFNQIFARFVSLDRVWARTMKQIEDGTHKRDKLKVRLAKEREQKAPAKPAGAPGTSDSLDSLDVDMGSFDDEPSLPRPPAIAPPRPVGSPRPAPMAAGGAGDGMPEQRLRQLYDVYMQAKQRSGEKSSLTMDGLRRQIEKQIPAIKAKHKCETVDFKVVMKDGKAMLKAVPK
jgi:hypothetical protein